MLRCLLSPGRLSTSFAPHESRVYLHITRAMASAAKKDLRKYMKSKLADLEEDEMVKQSSTAQDLIRSLPKYQGANRIGIYLSMPNGEARTETLVRDALNAGKQVFVPYIYKSPASGGSQKVMDMLRLDSASEYEELKSDSWGIPSLPAEGLERRENAAGGTGLSEEEPSLDEEDANPGRSADHSLDVIVMPGVAFDHGMNRLGHGAGFYDRFLTRFCGDGTRKPFLGMYTSVLHLHFFVIWADV